MKKLVLLRHAQAASGSGECADIERPLTEIGRRQAREQGRWLNARYRFDRVLCSPSVRTLQTAHHAGIEVDDRLESIYEAPVGALLDAIKGVHDDNHVLLIGHNPGISGLAAFLTGTRVGMAPGAVVVIEFSGPAVDQPNCGSVEQLRQPPSPP